MNENVKRFQTNHYRLLTAWRQRERFSAVSESHHILQPQSIVDFIYSLFHGIPNRNRFTHSKMQMACATTGPPLLWYSCCWFISYRPLCEPSTPHNCAFGCAMSFHFSLGAQFRQVPKADACRHVDVMFWFSCQIILDEVLTLTYLWLSTAVLRANLQPLQ